MRSSQSLDALGVKFDDANLMPDAGLMLRATLGEHIYGLVLLPHVLGPHGRQRLVPLPTNMCGCPLHAIESEQVLSADSSSYAATPRPLVACS